MSGCPRTQPSAHAATHIKPGIAKKLNDCHTRESGYPYCRGAASAVGVSPGSRPRAPLWRASRPPKFLGER